MGSQVSTLALPLIAALMLGATPWQMGLLSAAGAAPVLVVGLFAGVWVDRLRRRPVMIVADVARAVLLLVIPLASALGVLTGFEILYAVALLAGTLAVLFDVAFLSFIPSLVREGELIDANSDLELTSSTAQVAGPGIGGALISVVGAPLAVLIDALSFLGSAVFLLRTRVTEALPAARGAWRRRRRGPRGAGRRRSPSHPERRSRAARPRPACSVGCSCRCTCST